MIRHLYLHIPFCHRVCPYCSFYKHTPGGTDMQAFVQSLLDELRLHQRQFKIKPATIYMGGGTPTALSRAHLTTLIEGLRSQLDLNDLQELCLESNPKTVSPAKATLLKALGVTRLSLGVQAWDQPTLTLLGRDHAPDEATETYHILRAAGIPSVNIDLMFSIPGQSLEVWLEGLRHSVSLKPDHISCYNLTYEEDTDFLLRLQAGELNRSQDRDADHFGATIDHLEAAGFEHYETSNYAQPGKRSLHNQAYWRGADYLGLGPSASSTYQRTRWKNVSDTDRYISLLREKRLPAVESEDLSDHQWLMERVALELRTKEGLALAMIPASTRHWVETLREEGLLEPVENRLRLTRDGKALVDQVAELLIPDEAEIVT